MNTAGAPATLEELLAPFRGRQGRLLEALHTIQHHQGWVSPEAVAAVSRAFRMTRNQVWGVITFYADFRTQLPPATTIGICHGLTCHILGSERLQRLLEQRFQITQDRPNPQGSVELRLIQCSGLCHLAPLLIVNGTALAGVTPATLEARLALALRQAQDERSNTVLRQVQNTAHGEPVEP